MPSVCVDHLEKGFGDGAVRTVTPVLSNVSLQVEGPAVVSIVGPNGVGKTTFLRLMAGILQPDRGTISIDGNPPSRARIGYVPQSNPVFPWRRVEDDIGIPLEIRGVTRDERRAQVARLVRLFSFDLPLDRRAHHLSGGQRQLVNLCRALVGSEPPKILLLDEPFASLDPIARDEFLLHLQRVRNEFELMVLLTTHQLDLAVLSSDMVIPFRVRPVIFSEAAIIKVDLPRPRSNHMRTSQRFQQVLQTVEDVFRAPGTKATANGP